MTARKSFALEKWLQSEIDGLGKNILLTFIFIIKIITVLSRYFNLNIFKR
jgi:hypothetical protein